MDLEGSQSLCNMFLIHMSLYELLPARDFSVHAMEKACINS